MRGNLQRLEPTFETASTINQIKYDDFTRIGISEEKVQRILDEIHGPSLEILLHNLTAENRSYYGVEQNGKLAAFACLGDWLHTEKPFLEPIEFIKARCLHRAAAIMDRNYSAPLEGLLMFGVSSSVDIYDSVAGPFIEDLKAHEYAQNRIGIRVAVDAEDDLLLNLLEEKGTPVSRKLGTMTIGGLTRGYRQYEIETA